ncbi:hypothetical protein UN64_09535 [Fictibacillus arsenicus]|uniref:Uncharacterized protein n=1 Tax=Fictibacillus arsenicus TaxID=255247 RepID=A0A1V3G7C6_9BACL|nr:hypothetical protein UN64_09535 [Fictibacillus arsenicus]
MKICICQKDIMYDFVKLCDHEAFLYDYLDFFVMSVKKYVIILIEHMNLKNKQKQALLRCLFLLVLIV